jgi:uncharacterized protein YjiS (DUF1127 family)
MALVQIEQPRGAHPGIVFGHAGATILALVAELRRRRHLRKSLGRLSARALRDVGLTPNEVISVCSKPLSQDAATELHIIALVRSRNW